MLGSITAIFAVTLLAAVPARTISTGAATADPRVVALGTMSTPRAAHSATALQDGRVLIAGGCTADSCEMGDEGATAELYDPETGAFAPTGRMATERVSHIAALLPNGRVLLAGGFDRSRVVASSQVYDPTTGTFADGPDMATPRAGATATPLRDGRILVAGGFDGRRRLATAEVYDPTTGSFAPTGDMATPRGEHAAALLPDGRVLVVGGSREQGKVLASAEVYDPAIGTFSATGDLSAARHKLAAIGLVDGRVLVVGGADARDGRGRYASTELYDPASGTFGKSATMAAARYKLPAAVVALPDGTVLIAGGDQRAELYDHAVDRLRTVDGDLGADWAFATATALPDGSVLIAGGYDATIRPTAGAWLYRPA